MDNRRPQWCNWCRLCAKDDPETNVNLHLRDHLATKDNVKSSLKQALKKYFCIEASDDGICILCVDCNTFVSSIIKFGERVKKVQQMYTHLMQTPQDDPCDLRSIRLKFNVLDDHNCHGQFAKSKVVPISFQDTQEECSTEFIIKEESIDTNHFEYDEEPLECDAPEDEDDPFETMTDSNAYNPSNSFSEEETKQTRKSKGRKRKIQKKTDIQIDEEKHINTITDRNENSQSDSISEEEAKLEKIIRRKRRKQKEINRKKKDEIRIDYTMDAACAVCAEKFCLFSTYCDHMLVSHVNNQLKCITCNRELQSRYDFERHLRKHLPKNSIIKHICTICGLELSCSTTLKRHLSVHSDKMQHLCDHCGRAFKRDTTLKAHMILHTGLKPYSCNFCDLTFACSSNCRRHMRKAHPEEFAALQAFGNKAQTKNTS